MELGFDGCKKFVDLMAKADFSMVSSEEKLVIIRRFLKNPNLDERDLYYLGLLKPEKIPKGKRSKRKRTNDHSSEAAMAEVPPLLNNSVLNPLDMMSVSQQQKLILMDDKLQQGKPKRLKIIMSGKPTDGLYGGESGDEDKCRARPKKRLKKLAAPAVDQLLQLPELPPKLKKRIEKLDGSEVMLVMEKELCKSDINSSNGRLSLPPSKINPEFLIPKEREFLSNQTGSATPRMQVPLIQPCGKECKINLRLWYMQTTSIYNLVTSWNAVVRSNSLHQGMVVQLWSFRVGAILRLALVEAGKDIKE